MTAAPSSRRSRISIATKAQSHPDQRRQLRQPSRAADDTNRMLLTHWSAESFVVQLSIITPKAASAE